MNDERPGRRFGRCRSRHHLHYLLSVGRVPAFDFQVVVPAVEKRQGSAGFHQQLEWQSSQVVVGVSGAVIVVAVAVFVILVFATPVFVTAAAAATVTVTVTVAVAVAVTATVTAAAAAVGEVLVSWTVFDGGRRRISEISLRGHLLEECSISWAEPLF